MRDAAAAPAMTFVFTIDVALQPPIVLTEAARRTSRVHSHRGRNRPMDLGFGPRSSLGEEIGQSNDPGT